LKPIAAILLLAVSAAQSSDTYSNNWERMSAEHDRLISTPAGRDYEQRLIEVHNTFWRDVYALCIADARREAISVFRAIAVIDSEGAVTEFLPMPNSRHLSCFTKNMVGRRYPRPPAVPFYERFKIYLSQE
jgi:hypothetical protein